MPLLPTWSDLPTFQSKICYPYLHPTCCCHHIHSQIQIWPCQCPVENSSVIFHLHNIPCFPLLLSPNRNLFKVCDYHCYPDYSKFVLFLMVIGISQYAKEGKWRLQNLLAYRDPGNHLVYNSLINRWRNWGSERVCDLSRVTWEVYGMTRTRIQIFWTLILSLFVFVAPQW